MRRGSLIVLGGLLLATPLAGQENPFSFTGGSVKTAYIVYDIISRQPGAAAGASWEMGVAPDRWIIKSVMPFEIGGKKDTLRSLMVTTRDSQYSYTVMGENRESKVSPMLRPHVAREYAALNAAGKARFKENLKLIAGGSSTMGSSSDANELITLTGQKSGTETVAGQKCDGQDDRLRRARCPDGGALLGRREARDGPGSQEDHAQRPTSACRRPAAQGGALVEGRLRRCGLHHGNLVAEEIRE